MSKVAKVQKPFYQRKWFIILAVFFIIGSIGNALSGDEPEAPESTAVVEEPTEAVEVEVIEEPTEAAEVEVIEEPEATVEPEDVLAEDGILQNDYFVLYTKIMYYAVQVDDVHAVVVAMEESYDTGEATDLEFYNLLDGSEDTADNLNRLFWKLDVPESFPEEQADQMEEVIDSFMMGAVKRSEAYEAYKDYLDTGSLESANNVQTCLERSGAYFASGNLGLLEVELAIGVERDENGEIVR